MKIKRVLSLVLTLLLILGLFASMPLTSTAGDFIFDGTQSSWAESELEDAFDLDLTYPEVMKNFQAAITREEFCTIVVKLYEAITGEAAKPVSPNPFTDTSNPEVLKANNLKIVFGTGGQIHALRKYHTAGNLRDDFPRP